MYLCKPCMASVRGCVKLLDRGETGVRGSDAHVREVAGYGSVMDHTRGADPLGLSQNRERKRADPCWPWTFSCPMWASDLTCSNFTKLAVTFARGSFAPPSVSRRRPLVLLAVHHFASRHCQRQPVLRRGQGTGSEVG